MAERKVWEVSYGPATPMGYQQLTVGTSVVGLPSVPADARRAVLRVLTSPVNYRDDGVNPTATTGFPILKDEVYIYDGDLAAFKVIRDLTAILDADVRIAYYG